MTNLKCSTYVRAASALGLSGTQLNELSISIRCCVSGQVMTKRTRKGEWS